MICPYCKNIETKVVDKRDSDDVSKRRRECLNCERRFNTIERVEKVELRVMKKDGCLEEFDIDKIKRGIMKAGEKRSITSEQIDKMITNIEEKLRIKGKEVRSDYIGELVSRELKKVDKVAYIRFASVYKEFADISDFKKEISELKERAK